MFQIAGRHAKLFGTEWISRVNSEAVWFCWVKISEKNCKEIRRVSTSRNKEQDEARKDFGSIEGHFIIVIMVNLEFAFCVPKEDHSQSHCCFLTTSDKSGSRRSKHNQIRERIHEVHVIKGETSSRTEGVRGAPDEDSSNNQAWFSVASDLEWHVERSQTQKKTNKNVQWRPKKIRQCAKTFASSFRKTKRMKRPLKNERKKMESVLGAWRMCTNSHEVIFALFLVFLFRVIFSLVPMFKKGFGVFPFARSWTWDHCTSTRHRSETNGLVQRAVRRMKEGMYAALLQSGLDEIWWSDSKKCCCCLQKCPRLLGRRENTAWKTIWRAIQRANNTFWSNGWMSSDFSETKQEFVIWRGRDSRNNHRYSVVMQALALNGSSRTSARQKLLRETEKEFNKLSRSVWKVDIHLLTIHKTLANFEWRLIMESSNFDTSSIRNEWHCSKSGAKSEGKNICSIIAIWIGWKMLGWFHGVVLPSVKCSRPIGRWEDTSWVTIGRTFAKGPIIPLRANCWMSSDLCERPVKTPSFWERKS